MSQILISPNPADIVPQARNDKPPARQDETSKSMFADTLDAEKGRNEPKSSEDTNARSADSTSHAPDDGEVNDRALADAQSDHAPEPEQTHGADPDTDQFDELFIPVGELQIAPDELVEDFILQDDALSTVSIDALLEASGALSLRSLPQTQELATSATLPATLAAGTTQTGQAGALAQRFASLVSGDIAVNPNQPLGASGLGDMAAFNQNGLMNLPTDATVAPSQTFSEALANANLNGANADASDVAFLFSEALAKSSQSPVPGDSQAPSFTSVSLTTGAQPGSTAAPQGTVGQAVPLSAIAVEINRQVSAGKTQFDIRLDPPELGRLNVHIELDASGNVRTHLTVERSETLEMLLADSRSLERALQQTGLKAEPGSVSFSLSAEGEDSGFAGNASGGGDASDRSGDADTESSLESNEISEDDHLSAEGIIAQMYVNGLLDIRV